ncbi:MAG: primosomal protein N' [Pseudomonadales bacterium]
MTSKDPQCQQHDLHAAAATGAARGPVVRVAVPKPLHQLYDYAVPPGMRLPVPGARVRVPFGRQTLTAICVDAAPVDPHDQPRAVLAVLDDDNVLGEELLALGVWLADYYQHPLGEVLATLLPVEARRGTALQPPTRRGWRLNEPLPVPGRAPRQQALLEHLRAQGGRASADALREAGFSNAVIRAAAARGAITREALPLEADTAAGQSGAAAGAREGDRPTLNPAQARALATLEQGLGSFVPTLLDGVTGSGKTEVYLRLIETVRRRGQQVLVLVPEIALTPQTLERFRSRFDRADTLHSNMTDQQRLQVWLGCRSGGTGILVGTRSAVLTPFARLGLIVVDEEHDGSFKQQDGLRYSARDVAVKRAQTLGIPLLLGSATPSFESLHNARSGRYRHLALPERAGGAQMPSFHVLDIRGHTLSDGISERLRGIITTHLDAGNQVLVFLNRRGYAPTYLCPRCGWQAQCRHCETRLTLHRHPSALLCHHCGARERLPDRCPACEHGALRAIGLGTQRTEAGLETLFPGVPLIRVDRDTTRSQKRLEAQLTLIRAGTPAILVGTQMLAKGHHFPNVTLVAVINADAGFLSADFRAPERTAQLIIQVAGRAGRAERAGEVWIQTYQPDNPMLRALMEHGYHGFAEQELENRRRAGLPPFRPMAIIRAEARDAAAAQRLLAELKSQLTQAAGAGVEVLGPVQAPIQKVADRYRYQLLLLADGRGPLHRTLRVLNDRPADDRRVRWSLDIDPQDTF